MMKSISRWTLVVLLLAGSPAQALPGSPLNGDGGVREGPLVEALPWGVPPELSDAQAQDVAYAERTGLEMYRHDQAAWGATDFLREQGVQPDDRMRGWVTEDAGESIRVLWISEIGGELRLLREMRAQGQMIVEGSFHTYEAGKALEPHQLAAIRARQAAEGATFQRCPGIYNAVVLPSPPGTAGGYDVFLLVALPDWSRIMVGGNARIRTDRTGARVLETKSFTKSCLVIGGEPLPRGAKPMEVTMSDVMGQTPSPVHVFLNLQHGMPFTVITTLNRIVWKIEEGHITPIDQLEKAE